MLSIDHITDYRGCCDKCRSSEYFYESVFLAFALIITICNSFHNWCPFALSAQTKNECKMLLVTNGNMMSVFPPFVTHSGTPPCPLSMLLGLDN